MQVDYLIVGQGICGTQLSWRLLREGQTVMVLDGGKEQTSSKVAAGIINPVTGRHYLYSWMIDIIMPFAVATYEEMGAALDSRFITPRSVIDFFPSPEARDTFIKRMTQNDSCLHAFPDQNHFNQYFHYDFGCGEIRPAYLVQLKLLMAAWRKALMDRNAFREEAFQHDALQLKEDGIQYNDIIARKIIFCDGVEGLQQPYFERLPFSPNKGEALIIESEALTNEHIFKRGMLLAPLGQRHHFWIGSNYQREFADVQPTPAFREQTTAFLDRWLKQPYKVIDHLAAVRPATVERRPFVGIHPHHPQVAILNGMGTKGTSLAPYFAHQLTRHLLYGEAITPEADVKRFSRILARE